MRLLQRLVCLGLWRWRILRMPRMLWLTTKEEYQWLLNYVCYATGDYPKNWWVTFGVGTTFVIPKRMSKTDYNATRLKMLSSFSNLMDYKQIPKILPTVIFDWLLFRPPDYFFGFCGRGWHFLTTRYFGLLGNFTDYYFFRLLGISDYYAFFPTTIF